MIYVISEQPSYYK